MLYTNRDWMYFATKLRKATKIEIKPENVQTHSFYIAIGEELLRRLRLMVDFFTL